MDVILKSGILAIVLAVAFTCTYILSRRRLSASLATQSQVIHTAVGPIEYIDIGEGPVIVHLHGMLGGYDHWKWCQFLVKAGYRVIVPSRPGYLRTPLSSGRTPAEQAILLAALLDALEVDQATLYAYSQGGTSALEFAWSFPERCRGLILFSSLTRQQPDLIYILPYIRLVISLDFLLWLLKPLILPWFMNEARKTLPKEVQQDQEKMKGIHEIFGAFFQGSLRGHGLTNDFSNTVSWPGLPLECLATPALVLHGGKDAFIKAEDSEMAAHKIPKARFLYLEEAGHDALVTCIDQIKPDVLDFLNMHSPVVHIA